MNKNPSNTLFNVKRLLGRDFDDPFIQENMKYWPYKVVKEFGSGRPKIEININNEQKFYYIEEILAMELLKIKQTASKYLGKEVKEAVIGVPNYFNFAQRQMIRDAAKISGLKVNYTIGGPNLAACQYQFDYLDFNKKEEKIS